MSLALVAPRVSGRARGSLLMIGPAFVTGIAYVDPGNVAANVSAGSRYGYTLLWVVLLANLGAALIQSLAAKLGLATGADLAELTRTRFGARTSFVLWLQAEVVAIATDVAEVVGGALALQILFGLPLLLGGLLTAVAAYAVVALRRRRFELAVGALFVVIAAGFGYDLLRAEPSAAGLAGGLVPRFAGGDSVLLAAAIVGATVMPHAVYVHSSLSCRRAAPGRGPAVRQALRLQRIDVAAAMAVAGAVNAAMVVIAAAALRGGPADVLAAHQEIGRVLGGGAGFAFAVALLASGVASTGVGTVAGEVVVAGYLRRRVPAVTRRVVTLLPSLAVLALGVSATSALVLSQVVLSFGVPFTLVPLVALTRDRAVMGGLVNRPVTTAAAAAFTAGVVAINGWLLAGSVL